MSQQEAVVHSCQINNDPIISNFLGKINAICLSRKSRMNLKIL